MSSIESVAGLVSDALPVRVDPRVRRTRLALQDALGALLDGGAAITMSAIAHGAGLSRQVLHAHYGSVDQLASEVLTRRMLEGTGHEAVADAETATRSLTDAVRREGLVPFLEFIQRDRETFMALRRLAHGRTTVVLSRVFTGLVTDLADDGPTDTADPHGDAALFVAGGMTALMDAWLRAEQPASPSEQAARMNNFARAVFAADGQPDQSGPER